MSATFRPPSSEPGAYRWYYVDATCGEWTAVAIFMLGAQFSYRYSVAGGRGETAERHCAVNFALYRGGRRRAWVLSEYRSAQVLGQTLTIGRSTLTVEGGCVRASIDEHQAPFGGRLAAELVLRPLGPPLAEVQLVPGQPHFWQPLVPRAAATLRVPALGADGAGDGYHDTNRGTEALGAGLPGWDWSRTHGAHATLICYRPWAGGEVLDVRADGRTVELVRRPAGAELRRRSRWGLSLPRAAPRSTLETSPFYSRLEARDDGRHVMTEVADFRRFHRPWVRWMALLRTRPGAAA